MTSLQSVAAFGVPRLLRPRAPATRPGGHTPAQSVNAAGNHSGFSLVLQDHLERTLFRRVPERVVRFHHVIESEAVRHELAWLQLARGDHLQQPSTASAVTDKIV